MTSPSSSTASSPIPVDAYFADLYPLASPVHSRSPSPSPIYAPPPPPSPPPPPTAGYEKSNRNQHHHKHIPNQASHNIHNQSHTHRPPPYRPRLEFAPPKGGAYRPSLSFLSSGGTSPASMSASPLMPESPLGGRGGEGEKYTVLKEEEERDLKEGMVSAQKMKRRAQNRAAQRAFRARQTERVAELEREVEGLRRELVVLRGRGRGRGKGGNGGIGG
ncbi:hypothetical protein VE00_04895 [Pseudogymnoascus sp. WSF 3629]|nr:hypothetical protein VE00_04895 [Pseudogymnoascus sp. WSF 3629]